MKKTGYLLIILLFFYPGILGAQAPASVAPTAVPEDYRLGRGDKIQISVFGVQEFDYEVRIGSSGEITLPYVGEVRASGLTARELSLHLEELMDGKLFKNPAVSVVVQEHRSSPIIVLGAVNQPGTYQKETGNLNLMDMISKVGGISDAAGDHLIIQRHHSPEDLEPELIQVNLDDLINKGVLALNIPLRGGDIITVPPRETEPAGVFYVIGEVLSPGIFQLPPERSVLVTQAIAGAGGPARTAKTQKGVLVRYHDDGTSERMAVNFKKMLNGKLPDFEVQSSDIIFIPGSSIKTIGYGLLGVIPSTVQTTATRGIRP